MMQQTCIREKEKGYQSLLKENGFGTSMVIMETICRQRCRATGEEEIKDTNRERIK